jgi:hypothetical protein
VGFNISGIINSGATEKAILDFENEFNIKLKPIKNKVAFYEATNSKYESKFVDFYFTDKGFIAFCDNNLFKSGSIRQLSETNKSEIIHFDFSETSMAFYIEKYTNGSSEWKTGVLFEEKFTHIGDNILNINENTDVIFDTFSKLTEEYLGFNFGKMNLEVNVKRFEFISENDRIYNKRMIEFRLLSFFIILSLAPIIMLNKRWLLAVTTFLILSFLRHNILKSVLSKLPETPVSLIFLIGVVLCIFGSYSSLTYFYILIASTYILINILLLFKYLSFTFKLNTIDLKFLVEKNNPS